MTLRAGGDVAMTLHYHEHVVDPNSNEEERNDGVHRTEDQTCPGADPVTGEKSEKTTAETHGGQSGLEMRQ